jgi:hypothetical protein
MNTEVFDQCDVTNISCNYTHCTCHRGNYYPHVLVTAQLMLFVVC